MVRKVRKARKTRGKTRRTRGASVRPRVRARVDVSSYLTQLRESIAQWLPSKSLPLIDGRRWSDRMLVIAAVLMSWAASTTLGQRFAAARDAVVKMYPSRKRPGETYEGFVAALTRRGLELLAVMVDQLREKTRRMAEDSGGWRVGDWLAFAVDSTKLDLPMSRANEDEQTGFGCASKDKSWPQMLLGTLVHLGTGLPWSWRCSGARGSERDLLRTMLEDLPCGLGLKTLLLADAGFVGFDLMKSILACGHQFIIRVGANVKLIEKLGYAVKEHDGIVYLWPKQAQGNGLSPLVLRRVTVVDGRNRRMVLLCSVLEASELSDAQAAELYRRRWGIELFYRTLKQTLARGKLLSDCPEHAYAEAEWTMIGLWVLGLSLLSERPAEVEANRSSVAMALRAVRNAMGGRIAPGRRDMRVVLRSCLKDAYVRHSAKAARHWPHKKRCKPPGEPLARMAEESEVTLAQRLRSERMAA